MVSVASRLSTTIDISSYLLTTTSQLVGQHDVEAVLGFADFPSEVSIMSDQNPIPALSLWVRTTTGYRRGNIIISAPHPSTVGAFEEALSKDNLNDVAIWISAIGTSHLNQRLTRAISRALDELRDCGTTLISQDRYQLSQADYRYYMQTFLNDTDDFVSSLGQQLRIISRTLKTWIRLRKSSAA